MPKAKTTWKILCWNVNGVRAIAKKGFLDWVQKEKPDVLCLQETKAQEEQLGPEIREIGGYESFWESAEKKGYSGTAIYTRHQPVEIMRGFGVSRFDSEGRTLIAEFPGFTLFNIYFPNGKRSKERLQYKMDFYAAILKKWDKLRKAGKKLVICGDVNTAHKEIDLARPKENRKTSGFLPEERAWIDKIVDRGYLDIFRQFNQKPEQYTYWDMMTRARDRNVGWRIDYFFVTEDLASKIKDAWHLPKVMGSDHCPIGIEIKV